MGVRFAKLRENVWSEMSVLNTLAGRFLFHSTFSRNSPEVAFEVDARFNNRDALAFEEFSLQGCVGFADQDFSALAENTMPGNAFAGRRRGHGVSRGARAAWQPQGFGQAPIG